MNCAASRSRYSESQPPSDPARLDAIRASTSRADLRRSAASLLKRSRFFLSVASLLMRAQSSASGSVPRYEFAALYGSEPIRQKIPMPANSMAASDTLISSIGNGLTISAFRSIPNTTRREAKEAARNTIDQIDVGGAQSSTIA
jgi:hypothetical protein